MGEHRLIAGKDTPYEEDIRVPMVVRGPGVPAGARIDAMVLNIDLAPTFAEIAGHRAARLRRRPLVPAAVPEPGPALAAGFLIERRRLEEQYVGSRSDAPGAGAELDRTAAHFDGIRTADWTYVEYGTGERELYDLAARPASARQRGRRRRSGPGRSPVGARSRRSRGCAAEECRRLEDLPTVPAEPPLLAKRPPDGMVIPAVATN